MCEVLEAVIMKKTVLWDVMLCRPVEMYQCFRGMYCLHS